MTPPLILSLVVALRLVTLSMIQSDDAVWIWMADGFTASLPVSRTATSASVTLFDGSLQSHRDEDGEENDGLGEEEEEDWRDFRARLVLGEQRSISSDSGSSSPSTKSWAYATDGQLIERGTVILSQPRPNFGGGLLRHPFWHKAVMLLLEHEDDGDTLGILLNRPSDRIITCKYGHDWSVSYGGPVHCGLRCFADVSTAELTCLHVLNTKEAGRVSKKVTKNIQYISFDEASKLVDRGVATTDDFWLVAGYCGWTEGQLSAELRNGDWIAAAVDSETILRSLTTRQQQQQDNDNSDIRDAGLDTWNGLMSMIESDQGSDHVVVDNFHDLLLKEWARDKLLLHTTANEIDADVHTTVFRGGSDMLAVRPGMMFRASPRSRSPFLLRDQDLHRSIFLVISENDAGTVGVFINLPSSKMIDTTVSNRTVSYLLRYGGKDVVFGEGERDMLLLHCNENLRQEGVGIPLDPDASDGVWECTPQDVMSAIEDGKALPTDIMVISGGYIWTKSKVGEAGGIRGQVWNGNFEPIPAERIQQVWDMLLEQDTMTAESLDKNIGIGLSAWAAADGGDGFKLDDCFVFGSDTTVSKLADEAMRRWVAKYILNNPDCIKSDL